MERPWEAEANVSPALAAGLVEKQFPELSPARVRLLGVGWDNTAYLVNERWVFRFPRRTLAVELIRAESRVLPWLAPQLPLPISAPCFLGEPEERFAWPFAGYAHLPGRSASDVDLDDAQRAALAAPLGHFLRALHGVATDEAEQRGAPADELGRLEIEKRTAQVEHRLNACVERGWLPSAEPWLAAVADVPAGWRAGADHLVHGDFYARHVVVDAEGNATGVIDWGDVHRGDPAVDLSLALSFLPPGSRAALREAYGPIDDDTWRMARFKAVVTSTAVFAYAADVEDGPLEREGRRALENVLELG